MCWAAISAAKSSFLYADRFYILRARLLRILLIFINLTRKAVDAFQTKTLVRVNQSRCLWLFSSLFFFSPIKTSNSVPTVSCFVSRSPLRPALYCPRSSFHLRACVFSHVPERDVRRAIVFSNISTAEGRRETMAALLLSGFLNAGWCSRLQGPGPGQK